MAKRRDEERDDRAWAEPAIGGDQPDPRATKKMPGERTDHSRTSRIAEFFWRECDTIPLSVPRWTNRPKMNANIQYLLKTHEEPEIKASFQFFRHDAESLPLGPDNSCWDAYFRRRGRYLRVAARAREGTRQGEPVYKAGDIHVDNDRFKLRSPGEAGDNTDADNDPAWNVEGVDE